jgi:hypothetical protein
MSGNGSFEDRLKPVLLRSLIGFWSDVDEVRHRAGINVGASPAAWRALNGLVTDGLAECSGSDLQYRLTDEGRAASALLKHLPPLSSDEEYQRTFSALLAALSGSKE